MPSDLTLLLLAVLGLAVVFDYINGFHDTANSASHFGMPVSTTHVISSAIMGVGSSDRLSAVRWGVAGNIVLAWILTIPGLRRGCRPGLHRAVADPLIGRRRDGRRRRG